MGVRTIPAVPLVRHSVQVLIFDEDDRVLMLRTEDPRTALALWGPVGGGIEAGEDVHTAARREIAEETGQRGVSLGVELWRRRHTYTWLGEVRDSRERWFMARVRHFVPTSAFMTSSERLHHAGHRWWTVDELAATAESFTPHDLPTRIVRLLADGPPAVPLELTH